MNLTRGKSTLQRPDWKETNRTGLYTSITMTPNAENYIENSNPMANTFSCYRNVDRMSFTLNVSSARCHSL
ncbi:hypothetical protein HZH68_009687 [Vespula germanica]|uniref:Uncharacterized protein n=1 Tax=Vespula germanica TaxID=30212 RepID=A0A834JXU0_VESGE|nr:hypothetical protein HZH68_009687 [Vespula germanica]